MTRLFALAIVSLAFALPAAAASGNDVDPSKLVLRQTDLPTGFRVERAEVRTNAEQARSDARAGRLFARWGRITGYDARFVRGTDGISSRADLLRAPAGARMLFDFFEGEVRKSGIKGLVRSRVRIGDHGSLYRARSPVAFAVVVWRHERVFAGVATTGVSRERALALARVQQRRIAAVLG